MRMIADLVHNNVVDSVLLRVLVVAKPETEALRVKALKVLHVQVVGIMQGVISVTLRTQSMP